MSPDKLERLRQVQDTAIDHAIEEMDAASAYGIETKADRGDRAWLTKMCGGSLTVAARVEQFIALRERGSHFDPRNPADQDRAEEAFVQRAEAQMRAMLERVKPKYKHAIKG